jgi:hypothetical protein
MIGLEDRPGGDHDYSTHLTRYGQPLDVAFWMQQVDLAVVHPALPREVLQLAELRYGDAVGRH